MDFKQLQEDFRKLEGEAGEKQASALISIMDMKATQFEEKLDQLRFDVDRRFTDIDKRFSNLQWMMGIGFSLMALLITILKIF